MFKISNKITKLSKETLVDTYSKMLLARQLENVIAKFYLQGKIGGFCHLYIGQEAVVLGCILAAQKVDSYITSYRAHVHAAMLSGNFESVIAELLGKETGISKGKGGSMHMFDPENNFYGGHGIVGAQTSIGTGLALAHKYRKDGGVCLTYLGDGASNQGQFFESMNMAALWKLPVIYIIENNRYAMGTSVARSTANEDLSKRGESLGVPGCKVNGMDILEVHNIMSQAMEYVRAGNGPLVLEMETYRFKGHSMSDPAKYRTPEELSSMKDNHDPIKILADILVNQHNVKDTDLDEYKKNAQNEIKNLAKNAEEANPLDLSELYTDIYH